MLSASRVCANLCLSSSPRQPHAALAADPARVVVAIATGQFLELPLPMPAIGFADVPGSAPGP